MHHPGATRDTKGNMMTELATLPTIHDEFSARITPAVEKGLIRWEYYGDGVIPLLVDLEVTKAEAETEIDPSWPEEASVIVVWHKGCDITEIVDPEIRELMAAEFLETWGEDGLEDEPDQEEWTGDEE